MSTLPNSAVLFPDWKQEINRRVAAHKSARGASQIASVASAPVHPLGDSAAKAAARVAARFATAPTYSEMLAREARAAVDAAKAAAKAAVEAQAAFQFVLDGLEAAPAAPVWQLEPQPAMPEPATHVRPDRPMIAASWEMGAGARRDDCAAHDPIACESAAYDPAVYDVVRRNDLQAIVEMDAGEPAGAAKPIYANLIEFPRPMVAARRARPRLAEGPLAASDSAPQLSIFEVEPTAISTALPLVDEDQSAPPSWMRTEWPESASATYADASSVSMSVAAGAATQDVLDVQVWEEFTTNFWRDEEAAPQSASAHGIESAPLSRRLLAVVVDGALSAALLVFAAFEAVPHVSQLPGPRVIALSAMLALLVAGFAYHACFFTLFRSTPGMRFAGIEIDTLSGSMPARKRRWFRLMAMLLSLLPLGLGFVWALFDDDNLAWHDRLSGTYLRRR
ncbi:MAG: RDD family protein [Terracidiphilus sp.]